MLTCRDCRRLMKESFLAEHEPAGKPGQRINEHAENCASCHSLLNELMAANEFVATFLPETGRASSPDESQLDDLWSRLEPQLDRIDSRRVQDITSSRNRWRLLAAGAGLAASLVIVWGLAIQPYRSIESIESDQQPVVAMATSKPELQRFLNRVQPVMMTLANSNSETGFVPVDRGYAEIMALEAGVLADGYENQFSASEQSLLKDVQYLLLRYASMENTDLQSGLEFLQIYLRENTVLFRMNLAELRNRDTVI